MTKSYGRTFEGTSSSDPDSQESSDSKHRHTDSIKSRKIQNAKALFEKYRLTIISAIGVLILITAVSIPVLISGRDGKGIRYRKDDYVAPVVIEENAEEKAYLSITEYDASVAVELPNVDQTNPDGTKAVTLKKNSEGLLLFATFYSYLEDGTLICETKYMSNGLLAYKTVHYAEDEGCDLSILTPKQNKKGDFDGFILEEYKMNGSLYKSTEYSAGGSVDSYSVVEEYDDYGRVKKEYCYPTYGTDPDYYKSYSYNEFGSIHEIKQLGMDDILIQSAVYEYDEFGRVSKISYYQKGVCNSYEEYEYHLEEGFYSIISYRLADQISKTYTRGEVKQIVYDP